ncbi:inorganic polyphosphate kinase [Thermosipho melanesiensis]|uniref:NAD kinase n=2 Tax=Thermosipho melanesiensis TaxID=46541 RepID=NADK_THEM4|nr:NAD(+) kinase [Thermosipho melanesiensis]A6LN85.1 RecName: Full=NAD kinase; AltName: Full=ATP-dependent NAD kinase [Thermosipho melanesiensis BI429]ABR31386.1 NAD(+) kinase [Thermosipho melanesiensis BI429]APT74446.1 inorganic polyphosphate kinase [Thermosipho melanesiensis]OOC36407.1 inorganic polyphosphate kinase [Thermosipho melanesiensis]OOC37225.1 inorganic polyphosphate kinase [Thermosipho melanesiensis]OOC37977.1 inorganic polyphosphate kinase [Thermosipho melanesiensis]
MKVLGIFHKPSLKSVAEKFSEILFDENFHVEYVGSEIPSIEVDLTLVLGGDGTFLKAAHKVRNPLVGFKGGRLGFLSSYTLGDFDKFLEDLKNENFERDIRYFLKAGDFYTLNEVLLIRDPVQKMVDIQIFFQDGDFYFHADGLIISTPTGSTGYSLSLGGPIMLPNVNSFVITPVAPQFLASRSIIVPDDEEIIVRIDQEINLILDGMDFGKVREVNLKKSRRRIVILRPKDYNFSKSIKEKLGYGKRFL